VELLTQRIFCFFFQEKEEERNVAKNKKEERSRERKKTKRTKKRRRQKKKKKKKKRRRRRRRRRREVRMEYFFSRCCGCRISVFSFFLGFTILSHELLSSSFILHNIISAPACSSSISSFRL
jgi:Flp pilus assembly protein TadB